MLVRGAECCLWAHSMEVTNSAPSHSSLGLCISVHYNNQFLAGSKTARFHSNSPRPFTTTLLYPTPLARTCSSLSLATTPLPTLWKMVVV